MLCDAELWAHQVEHLADVVDAHVADLTGEDSVAGMARRVLAQAPERFSLAGLSLGGIVAFEILRREPERVTKLALLDTNAEPPRRDQLQEWDEQARMAEAGRFEEFVERDWLPAVAGSHDGVADAARRMARRVGAPAFVRQLSAQAGRGDNRGTLAEISCRTLVLAGRQDPLCPPELQEEIADSIPRAALVIVEECGHLSSLEQPHAVTAVFRYWLSES